MEENMADVASLGDEGGLALQQDTNFKDEYFECVSQMEKLVYNFRTGREVDDAGNNVPFGTTSLKNLTKARQGFIYEGSGSLKKNLGLLKECISRLEHILDISPNADFWPLNADESLSLVEESSGVIVDIAREQNLNEPTSNTDGARDSDAISVATHSSTVADSPPTPIGSHEAQLSADNKAPVVVVNPPAPLTARQPLEMARSSKLTAPEIPQSPLHLLYMELSEQLIKTINCSTTVISTPRPRPTTTDSPSDGKVSAESLADTFTSASQQTFTDTGNAVRARIANVLNQIQLATTATIFSFRPIAVAFQLSFIEHKLLRKVHPVDLLNHRPPLHPSPSLQSCCEFFNFLTRLIELAILEQTSPLDRSKVIIRWIKVANNLKRLHNLQTLKAVVSALGTPPIARLKRTWGIVKRKPEFNDLNEHRRLMSEDNNYSAYRDWIKGNMTRPMVPFLGVLIHDTTYLQSIAKKGMAPPSSNGTESLAPELNPEKHLQEIQRMIRYCTAGPRYSYEMLEALDMANQATKKSIPFRKKSGRGLSEQGMEELMPLKDLDDEEIGTFIAHWILSRKWIPEKEVDELSQLREPRILPQAHIAKEGAHAITREIVGGEPIDYDRLIDGSPGSDGYESSNGGKSYAGSPEDAASSKGETILSPILSTYARSPTDSFRKDHQSSHSHGSKGGSSASTFSTSPPLARKRSIASSTSIIGAIRDTAYSFVVKPRSNSGNAHAPSSFAMQPPKRAIFSAETLSPSLGPTVLDDSAVVSDCSIGKRHARSLSSDNWSVGSLKSMSMDGGIEGSREKHNRAESLDGIIGSIRPGPGHASQKDISGPAVAPELNQKMEHKMNKNESDASSLEAASLPDGINCGVGTDKDRPPTFIISGVGSDQPAPTPLAMATGPIRKGSFFGFSMPFGAGGSGTNSERVSRSNREKVRTSTASAPPQDSDIGNDASMEDSVSKLAGSDSAGGFVSKIGSWAGMAGDSQAQNNRLFVRGNLASSSETSHSQPAVASSDAAHTVNTTHSKPSGWGLGHRRQSLDPNASSLTFAPDQHIVNSSASSTVGWTKYSTAKSAKAFLSRENENNSKDKKGLPRSGSVAGREKEKENNKASKEKEKDGLQAPQLTMVGQGLSPKAKPRGFHYKSSSKGEQIQLQQPAAPSNIPLPSASASAALTGTPVNATATSTPPAIPIRESKSAPSHEPASIAKDGQRLSQTEKGEPHIALSVKTISNSNQSLSPPPLPPKPTILSPKSAEASTSPAAPAVPPKPVNLAACASAK
ncbi:hypothetical protein HDV05_005182 [Chytridiales sp. JEL 0842]|nr:hypothetical protein HDV05_005182 [Chytridiales sp. JEL 0842]